MKTWQYKILQVESAAAELDRLEGALAQAGGEGWEIVSCQMTELHGRLSLLALAKRKSSEIPAPSPAAKPPPAQNFRTPAQIQAAPSSAAGGEDFVARCLEHCREKDDGEFFGNVEFLAKKLGLAQDALIETLERFGIHLTPEGEKARTTRIGGYKSWLKPAKGGGKIWLSFKPLAR